MDSVILRSRISPHKNSLLSIKLTALESRLTERPSDNPSISLVTAGPRYGKTSLLASWVSKQASYAWLSVFSTDQSFSSFIRYLNAIDKQKYRFIFFAILNNLIYAVAASGDPDSALKTRC